MLNTLLGTKGEMTHAYVDGKRVPATKIVAGPCVITHIKSDKKDGYWAMQIGFGSKEVNKLTKPQQGHLKGATKKTKRAPVFLREQKIKGKPKVKVGDTITVADVFNEGDTLTVKGISKGKGFAGVMKRWGFAGGPRTHGQSDRERAPGSIGQGTTPGRVRKGKKMAGRMGGKTAVVRNLKVIKVEPNNNELLISGHVPGNRGGYLTLIRTSKSKKKDDQD